MVLQSHTVRSRPVLPEIVKSPLDSRAHQVGIAPNRPSNMFRPIIECRPQRRSVIKFPTVQVLMHVQNQHKVVPASPTDPLVQLLQVVLVNTSRFGFQSIPMNAVAHTIDAPLAETGKQFLIAFVNVSLFRAFHHMVYPVQHHDSPDTVYKTGALHRQPLCGFLRYTICTRHRKHEGQSHNKTTYDFHHTLQ